MRPVVAGLCLWLAAALCPAAAERPRVEIQTNLGSFVIERYPDYAPKTVAKRTRPPIENEANHGIGNDHYTVAMARDADPNSATSQFFINLEDNYPLNLERPTPTRR